jgi:mannose-6-phosphate isomerase-like protein (cupin superfamily)
LQGAFEDMTISTENAEHYMWSDDCDGWHLLKREDMSVIQERVPAGGAEVMHYHNTARQFFYILEGQGSMVFEDATVIMEKGYGIEIAPRVKHQFQNQSNEQCSSRRLAQSKYEAISFF